MTIRDQAPPDSDDEAQTEERGVEGRTIKRRLTQAGLKHGQLGEFLGIGKDSLSRLLNGARRITADEARSIEQFFSERAPELLAPGEAKIPVYGILAQSGEDRILCAADRVLDWVDAPRAPGLGKAQIIAVRVPGDSMEPRLHAGEMVYAARDVPPSRGGDVVVEFRDSTLIVKSYVGRKEGRVELKQYHPERLLSFRWDEVKALHAVKLRG